MRSTCTYLSRAWSVSPRTMSHIVLFQINEQTSGPVQILTKAVEEICPSSILRRRQSRIRDRASRESPGRNFTPRSQEPNLEPRMCQEIHSLPISDHDISEIEMSVETERPGGIRSLNLGRGKRRRPLNPENSFGHDRRVGHRKAANRK